MASAKASRRIRGRKVFGRREGGGSGGGGRRVFICCCTHERNQWEARDRRIAIVGAGLAGVGLAHALIMEQKRRGSRGLHIVVYDASGSVAGGASGSAAGLLHPLGPSRRGTMEPRELPHGRAGVRATLRSLKCAAAAFVRHGREDDARRLHGVPRGNKEKSSRGTGVLRCSALGEPRVAYRVACDEARDDNECRTNDDAGAESLRANCVAAAGGGEAVFIDASLGGAVDVALYLEGLWLDATDAAADACGSIELRAQCVERPHELIDEQEGYDACALCCGAGIDALAASTSAYRALQELASSMQMIRGHLVDLRARGVPWQGPSVFTPRGEYIAALDSGDRLAVGATKLRIDAKDTHGDDGNGDDAAIYQCRCGSSTGTRWIESFDDFMNDDAVSTSEKELVSAMTGRAMRFVESATSSTSSASTLACTDGAGSDKEKRCNDTFPQFAPASVRSGVRLVPPKDTASGAALPHMGKLFSDVSSSHLWFLVGLGFRGVVTHYLYAETLARAILDSDPFLSSSSSPPPSSSSSSSSSSSIELLRVP